MVIVVSGIARARLRTTTTTTTTTTAAAAELPKIYMLFAGWEVLMVKNCDRELENAARGRGPNS